MNKISITERRDPLRRRKPGLPRGGALLSPPSTAVPALSPAAAAVAGGGVGAAKPSYIPATLDWQWSFEDSAQPSGAVAELHTVTNADLWGFASDVAPPLNGGNIAMDNIGSNAPFADSRTWRSPLITSKSNVPTVAYVWVYMSLGVGGTTTLCTFSIASQFTSRGANGTLPNNPALQMDMRWTGGATNVVNIRVRAADGVTTLLTDAPHNTWYKLEFRNINYVAFTADIYVNGISYGNKAFINNIATITAAHIESFNLVSNARNLVDLVTVGRN